MDGDKLSSMSNVEEISFNQEQFELYLNYCEQLEALQREHHLAKSLALAKMNFALRYGKYLTDSQLEDLLSITAESLITRLINRYGKLKLANLNAQYLQQCDSSQMSEFLGTVNKLNVRTSYNIFY